ncbi:MAG: sugar phosphate isomerase/epimerase [Alphaproteobacteria bacterium]|nr:sugar phosphate isomerase/epimerase [Alphaproteobacteria bacterium]MBU1516897.1 sugar phosphate isomerase/epimerase [Alphaproteobacteria bacterium]MBU2092592.1 sugar phosphate isomerase/epimerase [Alphaproteobacteria bacterium]MBU2151297.1 sugar phosphate isomerase/epimerase [Alphaproteobacteria bacterium]MBU2309599.1 sugar phosphate isomerase/epimerase [Alphaproteobacteria bacterium]
MTAGGASAAAQPFFKRHGLPIGIQLYTLGPDAAKDLDGTLKAVGGMGYKSVELAGLLGRTPAQMKASLDAAGLVCTSAHIQGRGPGSFSDDLAKLAEGLTTIGVKSAVMPSPLVPERLDQRPAASESVGDWFRRVLGQMTADDWKMNADFLNEKATVLAKSGIKVGYHNHNFEFMPLGDTTGLEIMIQRTDPKLVTFELDVGWVAAAGVDPAKFFAKHKGRFALMHVKDIKADTQPNFALKMDPTEIGSGTLPWKTLLPAAYAAGVRGFYVEQEPPFARPRIEAAKISYDYLAGVTA